jgi:hypothetical protein
MFIIVSGNHSITAPISLPGISTSIRNCVNGASYAKWNDLPAIIDTPAKFEFHGSRHISSGRHGCGGGSGALADINPISVIACIIARPIPAQLFQHLVISRNNVFPPNVCVHRAAIVPRLSRKLRSGGSGATIVRCVSEESCTWHRRAKLLVTLRLRRSC